MNKTRKHIAPRGRAMLFTLTDNCPSQPLHAPLLRSRMQPGAVWQEGRSDCFGLLPTLTFSPAPGQSHVPDQRHSRWPCSCPHSISCSLATSWQPVQPLRTCSALTTCASPRRLVALCRSWRSHRSSSRLPQRLLECRAEHLSSCVGCFRLLCWWGQCSSAPGGARHCGAAACWLLLGSILPVWHSAGSAASQKLHSMVSKAAAGAAGPTRHARCVNAEVRCSLCIKSVPASQ